MKPPIFIIGCGRTGSKIPYQILNNHPDIGLGLEMHILNPWYKIWTSDLMTELKKIGDLDNDKNAREVIELCFDKKIKGVFWADGKDSFNIDRIKDEFLNSQRTYKDLFEIVLKENANVKNAKISGSKFPLHFYYLPKLKEWFPDSKIIHIIRDPRAILCSELNQVKKPKYPISKNGSVENL